MLSLVLLSKLQYIDNSCIKPIVFYTGIFPTQIYNKLMHMAFNVHFVHVDGPLILATLREGKSGCIFA